MSKRKTDRMENIELKRGKALEQIIADGIAAGMSWEEIARDLGIARLTLRSWVKGLGGQMKQPARSIEFAGSSEGR